VHDERVRRVTTRSGHGTAALRGMGESMKQQPYQYQLSELVAARRRAVLPTSVSRPLKRSGGRASPISAHVRVAGVALSQDDDDDIRRKLGLRLGKFAWSIERVTVRAKDANGPRGGVDQECTVKVVLSGLPSVIVRRRHAALHVAIDAALHAVEEAVRRNVRRRRMKPQHGRSVRQAAAAPADSGDGGSGVTSIGSSDTTTKP
jgi:ribosome-associated translation inhibitor RaiA